MLNDKIQHFIVCAGIVLIFGNAFGLPVGISGALAFAVGKEGWDSTKPSNRWDWWDIVADLGGITLGVILIGK